LVTRLVTEDVVVFGVSDFVKEVVREVIKDVVTDNDVVGPEDGSVLGVVLDDAGVASIVV
jgi:hypothetical protein